MPQRDWNCTECVRCMWHTGRGGSVLSRCQEQQRAGLPQGPLFSIRAISAVNRGICAHLQGKGFVCGPRPGWGWGFCSQLWPQGCSVVFPEINPKPQVCLSLFHLEQFEIFFPPYRTILRFHVRKSQRARIQRLFLLLYYDWYTILSQFMVYNCWFDTLL